MPFIKAIHTKNSIRKKIDIDFIKPRVAFGIQT